MTRHDRTATVFEETATYHHLLQARSKEAHAIRTAFIERTNNDKTLTAEQIDELAEATDRELAALYQKYDTLEADMRRDFNAFKSND